MSKIEYELYQVKNGAEHRDLMFSNMKLIDKLKLNIEQSHYDKVYAGSADKKTSSNEVLESLFVKFNLQFPSDYRARSMSVSDIVVLNDHGKKQAYFCDSFGFVEVPQFLQSNVKVTEKTDGLSVDGHFGTWHTVDSLKLGETQLFLIYFFKELSYNRICRILPVWQESRVITMKILIITNHSYMLYRFRLELITELHKEHEVVLSMPFVGHENDFQAMGLRCINTDVDRRNINLKANLKLLKTYRNLLKAEHPDLVLTYSIKPNIYAGLLCGIMGIPFCANVQGLGTAFQRKSLAQFVTLLYRAALKKAKVVFFENVGDAQKFIDRKILPHEKVTVLPGAGINLERYALTAYPENDQVHFLYLGRIMKEKGIDELFSAMRRLYNKLGDKVVLDLVGFFDDDYEAEVNSLVEDGIAVFHGFQTEPTPYYTRADCVVLPSYHEGLSNVLLEAAAIGRPVITSNIHGCKETVDNGVSGFLCNVKDVDDLYQKMYQMANLSRQEREAMGLAARRKIELEFKKNTVVRKTIDAIFEK